MKKQLLLVVVLLVVSLTISACSSDKSEAGQLPPLKPTVTALPHATATFVPPAPKPDLPEIDWKDVDDQYLAMRPEYVGDVDEMVNADRYYIEATLSLGPEAAIIEGAQRVRYVNETGVTLDEIVFRLYPNVPDMGGHLRVFDVTLNGQPVEPLIEVRNTVLSVPVAGGLAPGESAEMTMAFIMVVERGINPERFGFEHDQIQAVNWHPSFSVWEGPDKGWWKTEIDPRNNDPYYSEVAMYEMHLTYSDDISEVATSGIVIDHQVNDDDTITDHIVTGPQRGDNFLVAGNSMSKITDSADGTIVNVYFLPGGERAAAWVLQTTQRSLEVFNETFGDYPYAEIDVAQTYIAAGGVEYPGIMVVDNTFWLNGSPNTERITAHEVAHQWWYGLVGNNQGEVPWLDESITSYSEGIYLREGYDDNEESYRSWLQGNVQNFNGYLGLGGNNLTMNRNTKDFPPFTVGTLIYTKGRVFYSELEELIGREAFYAALQSYLSDKKYELSTSGDLLYHFEQASGQELDAFFLEWVGPFEGLEVSEGTTEQEVFQFGG